MIEELLVGGVGICLGVTTKVKTYLRVIGHGHYHEEDRKYLELGKNEIRAGIGLITGNDHMFDNAKEKLRELDSEGYKIDD
ncbi:Uncharacterised protein [uncultured archaeon]|nr:Uncharacterised protein [uncultured archaeon]